MNEKVIQHPHEIKSLRDTWLIMPNTELSELCKFRQTHPDAKEFKMKMKNYA